MFAVGRFQIIPPTLKEAADKLMLNTHALFDEEMQDRIFEEYLIKIKRPEIIAYLEGNGSVEDAIYAWAKEFASAGVQKGKEISRDPNNFKIGTDGNILTDDKFKPIHKRRWAKDDGVSYYSGDGLNNAHILPNDMIQKLKDSKNEG